MRQGVILKHSCTRSQYLSFKAVQEVLKLNLAVFVWALEMPWLFCTKLAFESNVFVVVIKMLAVLKNF
jgi:hypothetical protein